MQDPVFDQVRCGTCREIIPNSSLMKEPLGSGRLSVFCGRCQRFLFVYDPAAAEELRDMISTRNRLETRNPKREVKKTEENSREDNS